MLYVNEFTKVLPTALAHTVEIAPSVKPKLIRILDIWSEREVIIRSEVDRLRSFVIHGTDPNPVNPVSSVRNNYLWKCSVIVRLWLFVV
jgi:hypothetical protein